MPDSPNLSLLFLGDVVGEPGRRAVSERLDDLRDRHDVDFVVINGENAAGGRGITEKIAISLMRAGAAVVTLGDHAWDQREVIPFMSDEPRLLRPLNYPEGTPGQGSIVLETSKGKMGVIVVQGRSFIQPPLENPFLAVLDEIERIGPECDAIFVEIHAETTSEKIAMGRHLDGRVAAVIGTHTHVQTSDETIFPGGTAFLCDAGMCGPVDSILGRSIDPIVRRFCTSLPERFPVAKGDVELCGAVVRIDMGTGQATQITRIRERVKGRPS